MGRSKGIVEVRLEPEEVDGVAKRIESLMPEVVKGACSVDPTQLFGGFAVNSILTCTGNSNPYPFYIFMFMYMHRLVETLHEIEARA